MSTIQIGKIISTNRKEKGITQEELANHLGVSKPAVSKWESGQSYPDILLLPVLASFFNISVDQLIGYEPQMTNEEVKKLYRRLSEELVKEPFDKVYTECEEYIKKYFSCWYLQLEMGLLFINNSSLAGSPERTQRMLERALELFIRIEKSSEDVALAKQALKLQVVCYLTLQKPTEAIDILENIEELPMPTESLFVKAYQMKGDNGKAIEYLQGYTYMNLVMMLGSAPDYFQMYADQPDRMQQFYELFKKLSDLFEVEKLHPVMILQMELAASMVFMSQGNKKAVMDVLENYVNVMNKTGNVFYLHGNQIFDALDNYLKTADIGDSLPRSSTLIWNDLKNALLHNPAYAALEEEERFIKLKKRLEK
ncbi:MAG TPA: helix-turn-helix transcriptional regulator [Mobilitalea sp.]|nr:helix-turn-helix transcriptional regulator [Mobilitalea sp.]